MEKQKGRPSVVAYSRCNFYPDSVFCLLDLSPNSCTAQHGTGINRDVSLSQNDLSVLVAASQIFLAATIGAITTFIAWQQWRTNRNQFRLHLFDRRIVVFEAAAELCARIATNGTVTRDELNGFVKKAYGSDFIFNVKIEQYCRNLFINGTELSTALEVTRQATASFTPPNYEACARLVGELQRWFTEQSRDEIRKRFSPFLRISE